ncbi:FKBP-type peptidyl-prolyl cis-trans isomerase [Calditrichota bacterium LG25]|uniref:Peptidyl-prolyl cis-trans isomerase n=1 Tax=Caldithrix abyssi DSM 13497 TaxID=880073 RepID=H1XYE1_CALAY|nr:peptidylprolyl isomerase [Caldithrix abyssi]APF19303.1 FKBP-type peptidyl prolyl cis-trans isomerase /Apo-metallochaperone SlyD [Caldithrix abyssi DSM 13497]EHO43208.1 peptidylprolyl isomerase FKBP-type [Caldithrix abyssi DSM 13497]
MQISENKVVSIHYTLKNDAGEVLDSSIGQQPLSYLHGRKNIISGLENALTGKNVGDKFHVDIPPEEAYGLRNDDLFQVLPREVFQGVENIEVGMQFYSETPEGVQMITVTNVNGDEITVDANHPLAGETLHFDVEVVDIRDATEEELQHGHVHDGSHQH